MNSYVFLLCCFVLAGFGLTDQKELLTEILPEKGFVCYWSGNGKVWRITDCWLDHFAYPNWSRVSCVNARKATPIMDRMEAIFQNTLKN
jgi:hypothetical protein